VVLFIPLQKNILVVLFYWARGKKHQQTHERTPTAMQENEGNQPEGEPELRTQGQQTEQLPRRPTPETHWPLKRGDYSHRRDTITEEILD
jgi:hypothetical protein